MQNDFFNKLYTSSVLSASGVGLEYVYGDEVGHRFEEQITAEELIDLSQQLEEVIGFIEYYEKHVCQIDELKNQ